MTEFIVILVTAADRQEAETMVDTLVRDRLVACGSIVGGVRSLFHWQGKIDQADEHLIVMKGRSEQFGKIEQRIRELHSYEVPEIIALPLVAGSAPYLNWLREETA
ncbi:MAG: divalent-cation tolerance protein CutA [bacterium]|nr:divalent-cation tolerance protein CutA [bacterium]